MMHNAWRSIEEVPCCFPRASTKFEVHAGQRNRQFWPQMSVSILKIRLEFANGFEMIDKAWGSAEKVSFCFSRSSIKPQGHKGWKVDDLNPIENARPVAAIKSIRFAFYFLIKCYIFIYTFYTYILYIIIYERLSDTYMLNFINLSILSVATELRVILSLSWMSCFGTVCIGLHGQHLP